VAWPTVNEQRGCGCSCAVSCLCRLNNRVEGSIAHGRIHDIGDLIVFAAALLFGYRVGGLVGVVGAVAADFYVGYERWFVSILAHSLEGLIPGFAKGKPIVVQAVACVVGGFLMATTYFVINVFIKGYPAAIISYMRDLFVQAGISIIVGLAVVKAVKSAIPQLR